MAPVGCPSPRPLTENDLGSAVLGPVEVAVVENLHGAYHADARRLAT
jgi:hypothetical protein